MEERRLKRILSHLLSGPNLVPGNSTACDRFRGRIPFRDRAETGEQVVTEELNLPITALNDLHMSANRSGTTQFCSACSAMVVRGLQDRKTGRRLAGSEKDCVCGFKVTENHERQLFSDWLTREGSNATNCCLYSERSSFSERVIVKFPQSGVSKLSDSLQPSTSRELVMEMCKGRISNEGMVRCSTSENSNGNCWRRGPKSDEMCASQVLKGYSRHPVQEDDITKERHRTIDLQQKMELDEVSRDKCSVEALDANKSDSVNLSKERMREASGAVLNWDDLFDFKGRRAKSKHQGQAREDPTSRKSSGLKSEEDEEPHLKQRVEKRGETLSKSIESDTKPVRTKHGDAMIEGPIRSSGTVDEQSTQSVCGSSSISTDTRLRNGTLVGMQVSRNYAMTGQNVSRLEDCVFCLIVQGRSPAFKLYEDEMCFCILDVHPLSHGHSLVIPKAHFPSLEFTPPQVAAAMCAVVPFISSAIMDATDCDSFNLLVNSGTAAGQVIFHTHFHIIPRRLGDNLWRSESACRRPLPTDQETAGLVQRIRHGLAGLPTSYS